MFGPLPSQGKAAHRWRLAEASSAHPARSPPWGDHAPVCPPTDEQAGGIGLEETQLWLSLIVPPREKKKTK